MKKMKIQTNRGKLFDWWINTRINLKLWLLKVDDEEQAIEVATKVLSKYQPTPTPHKEEGLKDEL